MLADRARQLDRDKAVQAVVSGLDRAKLYARELATRPVKQDLSLRPAPVFDELEVPYVLSNLNIKHIKIMPPVMDTLRTFNTSADGRVCKVPANYLATSTALANFLVQAQEAVGNPGLLSTHPAGKAEDYAAFIKTYEHGLAMLLTWLRVFGCEAWHEKRCNQNDIDNIMTHAVHILATLAYTLDWILNEDVLEVKGVDPNVIKHVNTVNKPVIFNYLVCIRELLHATGALRLNFYLNCTIRTGKLYSKKDRRGKVSYFTKAGHKAIAYGPYIFASMQIAHERKYLETPDFLRAFARVFAVTDIAACLIVGYLERFDLVTCVSFIEYLAASDYKRITPLAENQPREPQAKRARAE